MHEVEEAAAARAVRADPVAGGDQQRVAVALAAVPLFVAPALVTGELGPRGDQFDSRPPVRGLADRMASAGGRAYHMRRVSDRRSKLRTSLPGLLALVALVLRLLAPGLHRHAHGPDCAACVVASAAPCACGAVHRPAGHHGSVRTLAAPVPDHERCWGCALEFAGPPNPPPSAAPPPRQPRCDTARPVVRSHLAAGAAVRRHGARAPPLAVRS